MMRLFAVVFSFAVLSGCLESENSASLQSPRDTAKAAATQTQETDGGHSGAFLSFFRRTENSDRQSNGADDPAHKDASSARTDLESGTISGGERPRQGQASSANETLRFGEVGVACGVPRLALGTQVDRFPKKGRTVWRLYDTASDSVVPRTQYVTGFSDGCARKFTAALALFGSPALHETQRYSGAQKGAPYSQTDNAYEKIKLSVCNVGKGKPCPASRYRKLETSTSFVTVYHRFGNARSWMELFLHNGQLVNSDMHDF